MAFGRLCAIWLLMCVSIGCKTSQSRLASPDGGSAVNGPAQFCAHLATIYALSSIEPGAGEDDGALTFCAGQSSLVPIDVTTPLDGNRRETFDAIVRLRDGVIASQPYENGRWTQLNEALSGVQTQLRGTTAVAKRGGGPTGPIPAGGGVVGPDTGGNEPPSRPYGPNSENSVGADVVASGGGDDPVNGPNDFSLTGDRSVIAAIDRICQEFCTP